MKKIFTLFAAVMMAVTVSAQHEIGGIVGGLNGVSYKYWFGNNLALQADLAVGLTEIAGGQSVPGYGYYGWHYGMYDFTLNPNALYHFDLPANFKLYVGGGLNLGLMSALANTNSNYLTGKFGINGAVGATYEINSVPLVLALDFRPGYGLSFANANAGSVSFFDWKIAFAVRYRL